MNKRQIYSYKKVWIYDGQYLKLKLDVFHHVKDTFSLEFITEAALSTTKKDE